MQVNTTATLKVDERQARDAVRNAFMRVIDARKKGEARETVVGPTTSPSAGVVDGVTYTRSTNPEPAPQSPAPAPDNTAADVKRNVRKAAAEMITPQRRSESRASGPSIPGLFAGAALDGADDNLSTTEKFYLYSGRERTAEAGEGSMIVAV